MDEAMTNELKRKVLIWVSIALLTGAIGGSFGLYLAFQHNSMGEFFCPDTGDIDLQYSAAMFLLAAIYFAPVVFAIECILYGVSLLCLRLFLRLTKSLREQ